MRNFPLILGLLSVVVVGCNGKDELETAVPVNAAPEADAGPDQIVSADGIVTLDGSGSFDSDGDALTYHWAFEHIPEGSTMLDKAAPFSRNNSEGASSSTFIPDAIGTFVISLWVDDGEDESAKDYVVITTETPDNVPVANAGSDQTVAVGDTVALSGVKSYDPLGASLTYKWTVVEVPDKSAVSTASLTPADAVSSSFVADARGVYVINLLVNNGLTDSLADAVVITAVGEDNAPVANAGEDISAEDCTAIQLDGSGSVDADGDKLTYYWEIQKKPTGSAVSADSFSDVNGAKPTFFADVAGAYRLSLTVNDGATWSDPDPLDLVVAERSYNSAPSVTITTWPTVDAGTAECEESGYTYDCDECSNQTIEFGSNVVIKDADKDPYTLLWEMTDGDGIISKPTELVTNIKFESITPTEPGVCDNNEYTLQLTVTDCTGEATVATTVATMQCCGVEATSR